MIRIFFFMYFLTMMMVMYNYDMFRTFSYFYDIFRHTFYIISLGTNWF